ncbi:MAG: glucose-6-phosphate dehydrogenase [Planctomycetota bacterium]|nr:glucose-6-phosphate dehydrogenase [Planctomycetota bacterium]
MPSPQPAQVVILGASGDLTARKLIPALAAAFRQGHLHPATQVIGVARRPWDDDGFREHLRCAVPSLGDEFLARTRYVLTHLESAEEYRALAARLDALADAAPAHRVYYLAIKPELFLPTLRGLHGAGLLQQAVDGPRRCVVIEKPFGSDLASALALNHALRELLDEAQIFRIDHYLGKETVQNLLVLRFRNALFEPLWNQKYIELVQITVAETIGVEGRGAFYDGTGAVRDILQNHLLQILALIAMEPPASLAADDIRDEKVKVLRALRGFAALDPRRHIVRGQYAGYRREAGVDPQSETESFIAVRTYIDTWRWGGVPFLLRTGKALAKRFTSVRLQLRMPPHALFGAPEECHLRPNALTLRIQPNDGVELDFDVKEPGPGLVIKPAKLDFDYAARFGRALPDAYERLLVDVLHGDQSLFIRSDEIEHSWRWIDSLRNAMRDTPLYLYERGSWGPFASDDLFGPCEGRWWCG